MLILHGWQILPWPCRRDQLALLAKRLRLSRAEERCLARLDLGLGDDDMTMLSGARWRQAVYYLGDMAALLFAAQSWRNGHALDASRLAEFTSWTPPQSPICGADLLSHGVDNGPGIGPNVRRCGATLGSVRFHAPEKRRCWNGFLEIR
jgi:hypothetical protein